MLIGMTGKAGAGKDTSADYLVEHYGFKKLSFAGPLKAMLAAGGFPEPADRELKEQAVPGFDFTWREAAQKLGTEWGRSLDTNIWTKIVKCQIINSPHSYVLSDVRHNNEADMIRELGGLILHIEGKQANLGSNSGHSSEAGVDFVTGDRTVDNSTSHTYLHAQLQSLMDYCI